MDNQEIINNASEIFEKESKAIFNLRFSTQDTFESAFFMIKGCQGNILIFAVGKSAIIGEKIAATFSSLGIPAFFIHATEAVHGDLGKIRHDDVCIYISHSGNTEETLRALMHTKTFGNKTIAITGDPQSAIAISVDINLNTGVTTEVDRRGLAPTSSAIATLAIGDALALTIADSRGFTKTDFYRYHPGGSLGNMLSKEKNNR